MFVLTLSQYYQFNGTFNLPLANISQPLSVFTNSTHTMIDLLNSTQQTFYLKDDGLYSVITLIDHLECSKLPKFFAKNAPEYVPNLQNFTLHDDLVLINQTYTRHYTLKGQYDADVANSSFFATADFQQDFYCIPLNEDQCIPVLFEIRGYNTITSSHTDLYTVQYDEFDFHPDYYDFKLPEVCLKTESKQAKTASKYGYLKPESHNIKIKTFAQKSTPKALDWRVRGKVTPVKDQAACGSCWAFAAAQVLEFRVNALANKGPFLKVSEQQVISCLWEESNGCNGGFAASALTEIIEKKGGRIPLQQEYQGVETECKEDFWSAKLKLKSVFQIEQSKEQLKLALLEGPLAVAIAVPESFVYYTGGVYTDPACGYGADAQLVHAVTAVGWGNDAEMGEYWIIKNSWSTKWGMDGYVYISTQNDLCGVLQEAFGADVELGGDVLPSTFKMHGRFQVPFANVTQEITAFVDEKRMKFSFFDDVEYTIWNDKEYYQVLTYFDNEALKSKQQCITNPSYTGFDKTQLLAIMPNLSEFVKQDDVVMYGKKYRHYLKEAVDTTENIRRFTNSKSDYQHFYCEMINDLCIPFRWEFFGVNSLFGSHYDYYILNYDSFTPNPTFSDSTFTKPPMECREDEIVNSVFKKLSRTKHFGYKSNVFVPKHNLTYLYPLPEITKDYYVDELNRKIMFPTKFDAQVDFLAGQVRDQCSCGSCWAFGTAAAISSRARLLNSSIYVSEQAIVDCIWSSSMMGCDGGEANEAIDRMVELFGGKLPRSEEYPYIGVNDVCQAEKWVKNDVELLGFVSYEKVSDEQIKYMLMSGPVTIAIMVPESMSSYSGGIYNERECYQAKYEDLAHQVTLTGWGADEFGVEYWIVKNSWSNSWGSNGYIYIEFGYCGVNLAVTAAVLRKIEE